MRIQHAICSSCTSLHSLLDLPPARSSTTPHCPYVTKCSLPPPVVFVWVVLSATSDRFAKVKMSRSGSMITNHRRRPDPRLNRHPSHQPHRSSLGSQFHFKSICEVMFYARATCSSHLHWSVVPFSSVIVTRSWLTLSVPSDCLWSATNTHSHLWFAIADVFAQSV